MLVSHTFHSKPALFTSLLDSSSAWQSISHAGQPTTAGGGQTASCGLVTETKLRPDTKKDYSGQAIARSNAVKRKASARNHATKTSNAHHPVFEEGKGQELLCEGGSTTPKRGKRCGYFKTLSTKTSTGRVWQSVLTKNVVENVPFTEDMLQEMGGLDKLRRFLKATQSVILQAGTTEDGHTVLRAVLDLTDDDG